MTKYKHIFFDLDRTLWDFESNSLITLKELFDTYLAGNGIEKFDCFHTYYQAYNHSLWMQYRVGEIDKEFLSVERFAGTLRNFNIKDHELAKKIASDYIRISPTKTQLYPDALKVVEELSSRYQMHIITNGFSEVQFIKVENSGLAPFFKTIITSEMAGFQKPNPEIFHYTLEKTGANIENTIMIGDDLEADILGAKNIGMDQVYVNFEKKKHSEQASFEVNQLISLLNIL